MKKFLLFFLQVSRKIVIFASVKLKGFMTINDIVKQEMTMKVINKATRQKVGEYKGFLIILEIWTFENRFQREVREHYELCKKDETTPTPWNRAKNRLTTWARTIEDIKHIADEILSGKKVVYTDAQRKKYVSNYNSKHGWGFSKQTLLQTMRMHQNGTPEMKLLMEDRLQDANFHDYSGLLATKNYEGFMKLLNEDYK